MFALDEIPTVMLIDDEKVSYQDYLRELIAPAHQTNRNNQQIEDCEWDWESEFMAKMQTNESFTVSDEGEERDNDDPEKFLLEMGLLIRTGDDDEYLNPKFRLDYSELFEEQSIKNVSWKCIGGSSIKEYKIFEDPFEYEFNPAIDSYQEFESDIFPVVFASFDEEEFGFTDEKMKNQNKISRLKMADNSEISWIQISQDLCNKVNCEEEIQIEEVKLSSSITKKKKLTEFGYLLQRKGFRLLRKYYKEKFENFAVQFKFKKRVKSINPTEIDEMISKFMQVEFCSISQALSTSEQDELQDCLKKVILCDRSN